MKFFKVDGQWSIDENEKKQMAGTLTFSKKGLRLKLLGSFRKGWSPTAGSTYPSIRGIVEKNPFGNFVTLYDCFTNSTSFNNVGIGSESIRANRAILSDDHPPHGPQLFESLSVRFTHLADWVGWNNFHVEWRTDGKLGVSIQYTKPENLSFQVDDVVFKVGTSFGSSRSVGRATVKERTHLVIEPINDTSAERASDKYLYRLQNLLTFATDTPNGNDENLLFGNRISCGGSHLPKKFHLFSDPIFRRKGRAGRLFERDMLFGLDDARKAGVNIFQSWFDFVKRHESFTIIYFAHIYRRPYYLDDKFRSIMSAFNIYCISAFETSERAGTILAAVNTILGPAYDARERPSLEGAIPIGPELDMPFHMLRLLNENKEVMSKIISGDFLDFVTSVCLTLSSIERGSSSKDERVFQGSNIYYVTEKLRWLMKIVILKELGFSNECVRMYLERNESFIGLKTV